VAWLKSDVFVRGEAELFLRQIADIERLVGRITFERANAATRSRSPSRSMCSRKSSSSLTASPCAPVKELRESLDGFGASGQSVGNTIVSNPPMSIREGGLIKTGVSGRARRNQERVHQRKKMDRHAPGIGALTETAYRR